MKRVIKFRAWHLVKNIMAEVESLRWDGTVHVNYKVGESKDGFFFGGNNVGTDWHRDDYELMQLIGITDKNGVDIYEGDLIKLSGMGLKYDGFVFYVDFDYGTFQLYRNDGLYPLSFVYMALQLKENNKLPESFFESIAIFMEIIGNIYENPELI